MMRIFIENLAKYNAGRYAGRWFDLPMEEELLEEGIKLILGHDEEYFIPDYNLPFEISEYSNAIKINEWCQELVDIGLESIEIRALMEVLTDGDIIENAIEKIRNGEYTIIENCVDSKDLALHCYTNDMVGYLPFNLKGIDYESFRDFLDLNEGYIDWEQLGDAMEISGGWTRVTVMEDGVNHFYYIKEE